PLPTGPYRFAATRGIMAATKHHQTQYEDISHSRCHRPRRRIRHPALLPAGRPHAVRHGGSRVHHSRGLHAALSPDPAAATRGDGSDPHPVRVVPLRRPSARRVSARFLHLQPSPLLVPMNPTEIKLVKDSFLKITPIAQQAAALFYARLFELDPQLRGMFRG